MDDKICLGINLLTLGDLLINRLEEESQRLKAYLRELAYGGTINRCVILEIFNTSQVELFMLIENIDSLITSIDEPVIVEELGLIRRELSDYQMQYSNLEQDFRPYMVCPAMDKPETRS